MISNNVTNQQYEKQDSSSQSHKMRQQNSIKDKDNNQNGSNSNIPYQKIQSIDQEITSPNHINIDQQQQYQNNNNNLNQHEQQQEEEQQQQQMQQQLNNKENEDRQINEDQSNVENIQENQQMRYNKSDCHMHMYKIVLVGDAGVGKTHIINRYVKGQLPHAIIPTIGIEFATKAITLRDGGTIKTQIWDTAGQEKYRSIISAHYRKAVGALLVYDVTKERSFESIQRWLEEIRLHADQDIVLMLVGNKIDLTLKNPEQRKVSQNQAIDFAKEKGLLFEESSALYDVNINDVFEKLLEEIYDKKSHLQSERSLIQIEGGGGDEDIQKTNKIIDLSIPTSSQPTQNSFCSCG